eukprot:3107142-Pyramimonas_sp.AAC.1
MASTLRSSAVSLERHGGCFEQLTRAGPSLEWSLSVHGVVVGPRTGAGTSFLEWILFAYGVVLGPLAWTGSSVELEPLCLRGGVRATHKDWD